MALFRVGDLEIDLANYRLRRDGDPIRLTPTEWALLREFIQHPNQVLTHGVLLRRVWGDEYTSEFDYVHTYVSRLRRKIEHDAANPQYIYTEAGLGYRFGADVAAVTDEPSPTIPTKTRTPPKRPRTVNPLPQHIDERYVGRDDQRDQIKALLLDNTRLVSIYGRAGVGKTALACKVLTELESQFDGMVFLSATSTGITLGRILSDFDRLLDEAPEPGDQRQTVHRITNLLDRLGGGDYVLLLDNLEHLQDPQTNALTDADMATFLRVVLEQGGTLRLLVTSRYPLHLPRSVKIHERVVALEEGLPLADGVALLRQSDPDNIAGLHDAADATLGQLVRRTHGLPRALEAVVGILLESPLMTPEDLLQDDALLSEELGELFVQGAIDTLSTDAVRVMERVSLFDRAVPLDLLEAFAQPHLNDAALKPILNRLVRAYFLSYTPAEQTVSMHPIDRDYCYQRLAPDERRTLHREIAGLYAARTQPQPHAITDLTASLSAFHHWVQAGEYDKAAALLLPLDRDYLSIWGNYTELADSYGRVIDGVQDGPLRRQVMLRYGEALRRVGRLHEGIRHFEQAFALANGADNARDMATALSGLAWAHYDTGQFADAIRYWERALAIFRETGDRYGEGDSLSGMGWVNYLMGRYEEALTHIQAAFRVFGEIGGQLHRIGVNIGDSGVIRAAQGEYETGIKNLREALSIAEVTNSLNERSYKGGYLATLLLLAGRPEEAEEAARTAAQFDVPANRHVVYAVHGVALAKLGRSDDAIRVFERAVRAADNLLRYSPGLYNARYARGLALAGLTLLRGDDIAPALDEYGQAMALCSTDGVRQAQGRLLKLLGDDARLAPVRQLLERTCSEGKSD